MGARSLSLLHSQWYSLGWDNVEEKIPVLQHRKDKSQTCRRWWGRESLRNPSDKTSRRSRDSGMAHRCGPTAWDGWRAGWQEGAEECGGCGGWVKLSRELENWSSPTSPAMGRDISHYIKSPKASSNLAFSTAKSFLTWECVSLDYMYVMEPRVSISTCHIKCMWNAWPQPRHQNECISFTLIFRVIL